MHFNSILDFLSYFCLWLLCVRVEKRISDLEREVFESKKTIQHLTDTLVDGQME